MNAGLTAIISIATAILGAVIATWNAHRVAKRDAEERGESGGALLVEVGYIKSGIDDIKRKQESQGTAHHALARQVEVHESNIKDIREDLKTLAEKNSRDHGQFYETEKEFQKLRAIHEQIHGGNGK